MFTNIPSLCSNTEFNTQSYVSVMYITMQRHGHSNTKSVSWILLLLKPEEKYSVYFVQCTNFRVWVHKNPALRWTDVLSLSVAFDVWALYCWIDKMSSFSKFHSYILKTFNDIFSFPQNCMFTNINFRTACEWRNNWCLLFVFEIVTVASGTSEIMSRRYAPAPATMSELPVSCYNYPPLV
jgi:hypothetical protein